MPRLAFEGEEQAENLVVDVGWGDTPLSRMYSPVWVSWSCPFSEFTGKGLCRLPGGSPASLQGARCGRDRRVCSLFLEGAPHTADGALSPA